MFKSRYFGNPFVSLFSALSGMFQGKELTERLREFAGNSAFKDRKPYRGWRRPGRYKPHRGAQERMRRRAQYHRVAPTTEAA